MDLQTLTSGPDRRRKAAMVVRLLAADGQKLTLSLLPEKVQLDLTREMAALRLVDRDTLNAVAEEFAQELESVAFASPGGVEGALAALDGQLSPDVHKRLHREAALARGIDPWDTLAAVPATDLARLMQDEGTEIAAIALSKLPVKRAAETLALLPGDRARHITYAMSQTSGVLPDTVARIGHALAAQYADDAEPAFPLRAEARVGAILNSSRPATRDSVLDSLDAADAEFAEQVRREIFTFGNIHERIAPLDIPRAIRGIDNGELVAALAHGLARGGDDASAANFILSHMSQRLADALRDEISDRGPIRRSEGEAAQAAIIRVIRERLDTGEIRLSLPDEDEDEDE